MKSFNDFREEISILELAGTIGYKYDRRKGAKWPVLVNAENGEKIIIINPNSTSNQGYFNPNDDNDKGTLIDFVKHRIGKDFPFDHMLSEIMNINKVLYAFNKEQLPEQTFYKQKSKIIKPFTTEGLLTELIKPDYLLFRHLNQEILNTKEFIGRILNIQNGVNLNIAFPFYNIVEKIVGIEKRNHSFDMFVEGSDRTNSIWHSNFPEKLEKIIIAESAIDAISYHQIKPTENALYVSIGGALSSGQIPVIKALKNKSDIVDYFKFVSIADNDKAGIKYDKKLAEWLMPDGLMIDKPIGKDYNKDLENLSKSKQNKSIRKFIKRW